MPKAWSEDEDRVLRRMWRAGDTMEVMSQALPGRAPAAVKNRAVRLELPVRRVAWGWQSKAVKMEAVAHDRAK